MLCKVSTLATLLCCICRYVYMHARLQLRGSAVHQARSSPLRHAALQSPTPVCIREVYPNHTHNKGPTLPLAVSLTMVKYHGTKNATRSGTTSSCKGLAACATPAQCSTALYCITLCAPHCACRHMGKVQQCLLGQQYFGIGCLDWY